MKKLIQQFARFTVVGGIAFAIDWGTMTALTELFGVPYLISTTIGFIVSVIFNYRASMRYVFRHKEELSRRREFTVFVVLSVIGLGLNDLLMWVGTDIGGIDYRLTKILAAMLVAIYNFFTRRTFLDAGDPPEGA
jgi:putative flippase GtrA